MTRYVGLPPIPARVNRLEELAVDLWWSWHADARMIFRRLDYGLWRATAHNLVRMLRAIPREKLEAAAESPDFLLLYDAAIAALDDTRSARNTWRSHNFPQFAGQS